MSDIKSSIHKGKKAINDQLRSDFILASKSDDFQKLCGRLKTDEKVLIKYTSKLEESVGELNNCKNCKGIDYCKNKIIGHVYFPSKYKEVIEFNYIPCKYFKNAKKANATTFFETPKILRNANLSDIWDEKERSGILKYIKGFLENKKDNINVKGLYLSGSFGSGKSYILSALINELSNKGYKTVNVYYPTLLQKIKISMDDGSYNDILDEICMSDVLLLDDIGAENNTSWARDEILNTILQYRMDNDLTTFFTSNYTINELEEHLNDCGRQGKDPIKARRIIERIRYLTVEEVLISKNKRN